jgi:ankyrin repeat protein
VRPAHKALRVIGTTVASVVLIAGVLYAVLGDHYPGYHHLMDAIYRKDVDAVRSLLASGIDPNNYPPPNWREDDIAPINSAADSGSTTIVGLLLSAGADIQATDPWGGPPLEVASRNGDIEMLSYLLDKGAKVNDLGTEGSSALYGAAVEGEASAVSFLLSKGANPYTRCGDLVALTSARDLGKATTAQLLEEAQSRRQPR